MEGPNYQDRVERKYQLGVTESEVASLWRELGSLLGPYGLAPVQEITSVASIYFDNRDYDLLRYSLFSHLMLLRLRTYELYDRPPEPVTEYWVEVKTAIGERRKKRRFRLTKSALLQFLDGKDAEKTFSQYNKHDAEGGGILDLYRKSQETFLTMGLKPVLLVIYKRVAFQSAIERLSIDWDVQYHHVTQNVLDYDSFKYLSEEPAGKANKVILEMKYLQDVMPSWFGELQRSYPIWRREYLKPIEGMGFLFGGPLKYHREANYFLPMIRHYMANSRPLK
jgi:SPX domain protein involved in polyphosphate accumulation